MPWTTPTAVNPGDPYNSERWNIQVKDNLLFLFDGISGAAFKATLASDTSLPSGTATTVIFGTEDYDQGGDYDNTTGVFTAPSDGIYEFCIRAIVDGFDVDLYLESDPGTGYAFVDHFVTDVSSSTVLDTRKISVELTQGDSVRVRGYENGVGPGTVSSLLWTAGTNITRATFTGSLVSATP